jgi:hypothetical protein
MDFCEMSGFIMEQYPDCYDCDDVESYWEYQLDDAIDKGKDDKVMRLTKNHDYCYNTLYIAMKCYAENRNEFMESYFRNLLERYYILNSDERSDEPF